MSRGSQATRSSHGGVSFRCSNGRFPPFTRGGSNHGTLPGRASRGTSRRTVPPDTTSESSVQQRGDPGHLAGADGPVTVVPRHPLVVSQAGNTTQVVRALATPAGPPKGWADRHGTGRGSTEAGERGLDRHRARLSPDRTSPTGEGAPRLPPYQSDVESTQSEDTPAHRTGSVFGQLDCCEHRLRNEAAGTCGVRLSCLGQPPSRPAPARLK